ncbi:hypothetical protein FPV67DRAFT_1091598 [Lyophyllum atratum]|nr:hypothetical protein FPV67DRAFT_1091598 [Lyophyllum atratum]
MACGTTTKKKKGGIRVTKDGQICWRRTQVTTRRQLPLEFTMSDKGLSSRQFSSEICCMYMLFHINLILLIAKCNIRNSNGAVYETEDSFFLHAFRTNGYRTGQYGTTLVANIAGDRLTPVEGIMISNLRPLTCWKIGDTGNGMLQLGMEHPTYPDLKAYRHEEKISKHAISKV